MSDLMEWIKRMFRPAGGEDVPVLQGQAVPLAPKAPAELSPTPPAVYTNYTFDDPSVRIAAVGDLHGRIDLLQDVAARLDALAADPTKRLVEVYLGDYIDRGGNPHAVLDFLVNRSALTDRQVICLAGNHEQMLLAALDDDRDFLSWLSFGGQSTLMSYGISPKDAKRNPTMTRAALRKAMPDAHFHFLKGLDLFYEKSGFFFVHAGVKPGTPLDQQSAKDMLWIRDAFLMSSANFGAVVVHGHTPMSRPVFRANRIGIDTGAYGSGILTCLTVTAEGVSILDTARAPSFA